MTMTGLEQLKRLTSCQSRYTVEIDMSMAWYGTYARSIKGLYGDPLWKANPNPEAKNVSCSMPQLQYGDDLASITELV